MGTFIALLILVALAFIPANIASKKGYGFGGFYVFGILLFLPALIVALVMEDKNVAAERENELNNEIRSLRQELSSYTGGAKSQSSLSEASSQTQYTDPVCRQCGFENPADSNYCTKCGGKLTTMAASACPKCRTANRPGIEFCSSCGWRLAESTPAVVLVAAVDGDVVCPSCGARQLSTRTSCYKCGVNFEYR